MGGWGGGWVGEESEGRSPRGTVQGGARGGRLKRLEKEALYPPFPTLIGNSRSKFLGYSGRWGGALTGRRQDELRAITSPRPKLGMR